MKFRFPRASILIVVLLTFVLTFLPNPVQAGGSVDLPRLDEFVHVVSNGEADTLRGIYVPDVLAAWIVSQPQDEPAFVSTEENTLTLFGLATRAGSTGLLAHNYLEGKNFSQIKEEQILYLVYGDGRTDAFIVTQILRFHALEPDNVWSKFIDLQSGELSSAADLFSRIYAQPGRVILQTCIRAGKDASWGRLFIIAEPYPTALPNSETTIMDKK